MAIQMITQLMPKLKIQVIRLKRTLTCFPIRGFKEVIRENIFACLFSVHNTISLHVMGKYV